MRSAASVPFAEKSGPPFFQKEGGLVFCAAVFYDIAAINNWRYEFVYGDFDELYVQLMNGEIDVLPCLVYTEERAQRHLFSDEEIYSEKYYISALNENAKNVTIEDLDGKRISSVRDCNQNDVFAAWAEAHGITAELVCTDSFDDSWELVQSGDTDFILNIDRVAQSSGYTSLFSVGAGSSRFAIAPGQFDRILMDVQMPVMDGYEASRRIRALENRALARIPIIAMTANAFDEDRQNALDAGMNAHVTKPVDVNRLKETLARFV